MSSYHSQSAFNKVLKHQDHFFSFRKYVQVCVQNLSELDFQLSDSHLVDTHDSTDLRLIPLNTESEQVTSQRNAE